MNGWGIALLLFVAAWFVLGAFVFRDYLRRFGECRHDLIHHRGEDPGRDRECWQTMHEGQG